MRILLSGTTGFNAQELQRGTGLGNKTITGFMTARVESYPPTLEAIGQFLWKRMNAHVLLCDEDRAGDAGVQTGSRVLLGEHSPARVNERIVP